MAGRRFSRREFLKGAAGAGLGAAGAVLAACAAPATPQPATSAPAPAAPATSAPAPAQAAPATSAPAPVQAAPTTVPAPAAKVSLVYWADPRFVLVPGMEDQTKTQGDYERILAKGFTDKNPNVTIDAQSLNWEDLPTKVAAAIAGGTPPDILKDYLGRTSKYANQDLLEPLEKALPDTELKDYSPSLISLYTIKGHLHGLPMFYWITVFGGNKVPFTDNKLEAQLPGADGLWPITTFEAALKGLAVKDKVWPLAMQVSSEQGDYANLGFFWANGAKMYQNSDYTKTTFNSPEAVETLSKLVEWYKAGYIVPGVTTISQTDLNNMLFNGSSVLGITGPGFVSDTLAPAQKQNQVTQKWDAFYDLFPGKAGQKSGGMAAGPTGVVIFKQKDDNKRKTAIDFARYLNSTDLQKQYSVVANQYPTRTSVGNPFTSNPANTTILQWSQKYGVEDMGLGSPGYAEVRVKLPPELQAAFLGKKTPQQALADFEKNANDILAKYK